MVLPGCGTPWIPTHGGHRNPHHEEAPTSGLAPEGGQSWPFLTLRRSQFLRLRLPQMVCLSLDSGPTLVVARKPASPCLCLLG